MNYLLVFAVCAQLVQGISAATVSPDDQGEQEVLDQMTDFVGDLKPLLQESLTKMLTLMTETSNKIEEMQTYQKDQAALAVQLGERAEAVEGSDDVRQEAKDYSNMIQLAIASGNGLIDDMRQALKEYREMLDFFADAVPEEAQEAQEEAQEDVDED